MMKFILPLSIIIGSVTSASLFPQYSMQTAKDISECPPIAPHGPPLGAYDLRADDIKVIAAIGDSVTAGLLAKNVNSTYITPEQFKEYRGVSWIMGGDDDAYSLANYFKHYSPDLYGSSVGDKPVRLCPKTFFCLDSQHDPSIDVLNAAQSGATSRELPEQVDYILESIGRGTPFEKEWKLINIFVGFNDASISCLSPNTVRNYRSNVYSSVRKLIDNVDYAFINLVGIMKYNELVHLTDKAPGYKKSFQNQKINMLDYECYCCRQPSGGVNFIGERVTELNQALADIADEVSGDQDAKLKNIAVAYQPMNPDISTVFPESLSNMDGYHPNVIGYTYMSKALWNQMYRTYENKIQHDAFDPAIPITCPTADDRLQVHQRSNY